MSFDEFRAWEAYCAKRGSLNWGLRLEGGFALVASQVNNALGGKATIDDFAPHFRSNEPISLEEAMKTWG